MGAARLTVNRSPDRRITARKGVVVVTSHRLSRAELHQERRTLRNKLHGKILILRLTTHPA